MTFDEANENFCNPRNSSFQSNIDPKKETKGSRGEILKPKAAMAGDTATLPD
jgi:hypothetical protein